MQAQAAVLDETKLRGAIGDVTGSMPAVVMRRIVDQVLVLVREADGAVVELADDDSLTCVCGWQAG